MMKNKKSKTKMTRARIMNGSLKKGGRFILLKITRENTTNLESELF